MARVARGEDGIFSPNAPDAPHYLNPKNPRYAPKLAATVNAWLAVTDPGGKNLRQALEKWLREHAARFGLVDDLRNPVQQAVEECSKAAASGRRRVQDARTAACPPLKAAPTLALGDCRYKTLSTLHAPEVP